MVIGASDGIEGIDHVGVRDALPVAQWPLRCPRIVSNDVQGPLRHVAGEALVDGAVVAMVARAGTGAASRRRKAVQ